MSSSCPAVCDNLVLKQLDERLRHVQSHMLGYQWNQRLPEAYVRIWQHFSQYSMNNLGDPFYNVEHGKPDMSFGHSHELERACIDRLTQLYNDAAMPLESLWGSLCHNGTEGNLHSLWLARDSLPNPIMTASRSSHYSIPKAARILHIQFEFIAARTDGTIDLADLEQWIVSNLEAIEKHGWICVLNAGTVIECHVDPIPEIHALLAKYHLHDHPRVWIHVDGAWGAMTLPFQEATCTWLQFNRYPCLSSLSFSIHKSIGCPVPGGVVLARRRMLFGSMQQSQSIQMRRISYVNNRDTTLSGSRNGLLAIWLYCNLYLDPNDLSPLTLADWKREMTQKTARMEAVCSALLTRLEKISPHVKRASPSSFALVLPRIHNESICLKYALKSLDQRSVLCIMQHVGDSEAILHEFERDWAHELEREQEQERAKEQEHEKKNKE